MRNFSFNLKVYTLSFTLLLLGILAPISGVLFNASSTALGLLLFSILSLVFSYRYANMLKRIPKVFLLFFSLILMYSILQYLFVGAFDYKTYLSVSFLFFIFITASLSAVVVFKIDCAILFNAIKLLVYILILIAFFNILTEYKFGALLYGHHKAVFPFGEPSHYALFSGIFFVAYFVFSKSLTKKLFIVAITISLAILFPNMTLLMYGMLMIILLIRINIKNLILLVVSFLILLNFVFTSKYFLNRIYISKDSKNLSALVYLQGLDYAKRSLINTNGLGLGFQMMGTQPPLEITKLILHVLGVKNGKGVNRQDGGFLAAKIVTEFGVLGIVILIAYLVLFIKSFTYLRNIIKHKEYEKDFKLTMVNIIFYSIFVEIFVRGIGYFSPSLFIFFIAIAFLFKFNRRNNKFIFRKKMMTI